jgi:hypothetical protein
VTTSFLFLATASKLSASASSLSLPLPPQALRPRLLKSAVVDAAMPPFEDAAAAQAGVDDVLDVGVGRRVGAFTIVEWGNGGGLAGTQ